MYQGKRTFAVSFSGERDKSLFVGQKSVNDRLINGPQQYELERGR